MRSSPGKFFEFVDLENAVVEPWVVGSQLMKMGILDQPVSHFVHFFAVFGLNAAEGRAILRRASDSDCH